MEPKTNMIVSIMKQDVFTATYHTQNFLDFTNLRNRTYPKSINLPHSSNNCLL